MSKSKKDKEYEILEMRKSPFFIVLTAGVFMKILSILGGNSRVISSIGNLFISASIFLLIIYVFNKLKNLICEEKNEAKLETLNETIEEESRLKLSFIKLFRIFKNKKKTICTEEAKVDKKKTNTQQEDNDLIEIKKTENENQKNELFKAKHYKHISLASVLYIVFVELGILWAIFRMIRAYPLFYTEQYSYNIFHSILLLIFPCVIFIYLSIRKDKGKYNGDKTSYDLLTILAYVSVIYAILFAVNSVLNISIITVLPWIHRIVSVYVLVAISFNILISTIKNDIIGDFNYTFIPNIKKRTEGSNVFDSDEVKSSFSLKSLWTIKYALKILPGFILALGLVLLLCTSFYVVEPYQQAAVYHFGILNESSIKGEGLHLKMPWPIDKVDIYDVERISAMQIGYKAADTSDFLWNMSHDGEEYTLLLGNGNEAVSVNIKLMYKIDKLYLYVMNTSNPEAILSAAAYKGMMNRTINTSLDSFLSVDRSSLSGSIKNELTEFCIDEKLGLTVTGVIIENIHPPVEVAGIYQKVVTASVDKNRLITIANTQAEKEKIYAEQKRETTIDVAETNQYKRISDAQSEMAVYYAAIEGYKVNPECFELVKSLDAYEIFIKKHKIYAFSKGLEDEMKDFIIGGNTVLVVK